jgi:hypothetical protein
MVPVGMQVVLLPCGQPILRLQVNKSLKHIGSPEPSSGVHKWHSNCSMEAHSLEDWFAQNFPFNAMEAAGEICG